MVSSGCGNVKMMTRLIDKASVLKNHHGSHLRFLLRLAPWVIKKTYDSNDFQWLCMAMLYVYGVITRIKTASLMGISFLIRIRMDWNDVAGFEHCS